MCTGIPIRAGALITPCLIKAVILNQISAETLQASGKSRKKYVNVTSSVCCLVLDCCTCLVDSIDSRVSSDSQVADTVFL
jgi:hypothetical protein